MRVDPMKPYQKLPPLPPAKSLDSPEVWKSLVSATRSLQEASTAADLLPNPRILVDSIPLLEAQASNEIENIVTTNDELFRVAHNVDKPTVLTTEGLRYREAINLGMELLKDRPLTVAVAKEVCSKITNVQMEVRSTSGTYIGNPKTLKRIYTPPEGKDLIMSHLGEWEKFMHEDDSYDPLVKLALLHYQFEAIHPFSDGNGRTGRIINVLYLVQSGLLRYPITYLSGYIVQHKSEYYRLLNAVTQLDEWREWVLFMLRAVEVTAKWTSNLIYEVKEKLEWAEKSLEDTPMPKKDTVHMLFEKPYVRYRDLEESFGRSRPTVAKYAGALEEIGLLERLPVGREVFFVNRPYLDLLFNTALPK